MAAIFDLDGVIVDSNPLHRKAVLLLARKHGVAVSDKTLKTRVFGRPNRFWIPEVFGVSSRLEVENLAAQKERLFRLFYRSRIMPLPGLRLFLSTLRRCRVPVGLGSSAPRENVTWLLRELELEDRFQVIIDGTDVKVGKPDPAVYLKAAKALGVDPERCVVFEDSLAGIMAARRAGCKVVGLTTTHSVAELSAADLVIHDFRRLRIGRLHDLLEHVRATPVQQVVREHRK